MSEGATGPKIFISYAWGDEAHQDWVQELAERLLGDGIDVLLDIWDFKEGNDKFVFMEQMVTDPDVKKVLVICDETYATKANSRKGGVGTESQIISAEVYNKVRQKKFIPILRGRDDKGDAFLPVFMKTLKYIDFTDDDGFGISYDALVRNIYDKPARTKPALGKAPAHITSDKPTSIPVNVKLERLREAVLKDKPHAAGMLQDYLDAFLEGLETLRLPGRLKGPTFGQSVNQSLDEFQPYLTSFVDFMLFIARYQDTRETHERVFCFLEKAAEFQERPVSVTSWNSGDWDNYRVMIYQLFLYSIAALIKERKYGTAAAYIEHPYHVKNTNGDGSYVDVGCGYFDLPPEELKNVGEIVKEHATLKQIPFVAIVQVDFLLYVRKYFPNPRGALHWDGHILMYIGREETPELFARATSDEGFEGLKTILRVQSRQELVDRMRNVPFRDLNQSIFYYRHLARGFETLLNLRAIEQAG